MRIAHSVRLKINISSLWNITLLSPASACSALPLSPSSQVVVCLCCAVHFRENRHRNNEISVLINSLANILSRHGKIMSNFTVTHTCHTLVCSLRKTIRIHGRGCSNSYTESISLHTRRAGNYFCQIVLCASHKHILLAKRLRLHMHKHSWVCWFLHSIWGRGRSFARYALHEWMWTMPRRTRLQSRWRRFSLKRCELKLKRNGVDTDWARAVSSIRARCAF